jgi:nitrogen fixation protein NifT
MPSVMIRQNEVGQLTFYVPKKDLEEIVLSIEHTAPDRWGGEVTLADGSCYYIEPMAAPDLPITVRAKRGGEA